MISLDLIFELVRVKSPEPVVSHNALQQTGLCENLLLAGNNLPGITRFSRSSKNWILILIYKLPHMNAMNFVVKTCNIYRFFYTASHRIDLKEHQQHVQFLQHLLKTVRMILRQMSQHSHFFALHQITVGQWDRHLDRRMTSVTRYVIAIDCSSQWSNFFRFHAVFGGRWPK